MKFFFFFLALLGVFALLNMYISKRLIHKLDVKQKTKKYLRLFLFINFLGIIAYIIGRYYIEYPSWLYFLVSLPIGVLFLFFCTAIIYDLFRLCINTIPVSQTRRNFFKKSLDVSSVAVAVSLNARAMYEATFIEHEIVQVKINNLKKEYKIVQVSDIHIGGLIDEVFIKKIVKRINTMKPDLVVITGDLVDISLEKADASLNEFQDLESKYGTYFIVGNHEYLHDIEKIILKVKSLGIRVLENENVYIGKEGQGFNLAGVYDVMGYRTKTFIPDIYKALKDKRESPTVLLAHQPRYIDEVKSGVDLMLSGHTHGGQIYPFRFLVKLVQPYISGLHHHNEDLQIYVNKGTGFWGPPMRLGASSEITEIILSPNQILS